MELTGPQASLLQRPLVALGASKQQPAHPLNQYR